MLTKVASQGAEAHGLPVDKYPVTPQKPELKAVSANLSVYPNLFPPTPDQTPSRNLKCPLDILCSDAPTPTRSAKYQKLLCQDRITPFTSPKPTKDLSVLRRLSIPHFSIAHPTNRPSYLGISAFELERAMNVVMSHVDWVELGEDVGCNRKARVYKKAIKKLFQEKLDQVNHGGIVSRKGDLGGKRKRKLDEDGVQHEDEDEDDRLDENQEAE